MCLSVSSFSGFSAWSLSSKGQGLFLCFAHGGAPGPWDSARLLTVRHSLNTGKKVGSSWRELSLASAVTSQSQPLSSGGLPCPGLGSAGRGEGGERVGGGEDYTQSSLLLGRFISGLYRTSPLHPPLPREPATEMGSAPCLGREALETWGEGVGDLEGVSGPCTGKRTCSGCGEDS